MTNNNKNGVIRPNSRTIKISGRGAIAAQAIIDGKSQREAARLAGYASGVTPMAYKSVRKALEDMASKRDRLLRKGRYSLESALSLYRRIADCKHARAKMRIHAQTRIDELLGLEYHKAPEDQDGILDAVAVFQALGSSSLIMRGLSHTEITQ